MIKAKAGNLIILGLSDENLRRLQNNEPIKFNAGEIGLHSHFEIVIIYGKTEKDITQDLINTLGYKPN